MPNNDGISQIYKRATAPWKPSPQLDRAIRKTHRAARRERVVRAFNDAFQSLSVIFAAGALLGKRVVSPLIISSAIGIIVAAGIVVYAAVTHFKKITTDENPKGTVMSFVELRKQELNDANKKAN